MKCFAFLVAAFGLANAARISDYGSSGASAAASSGYGSAPAAASSGYGAAPSSDGYGAPAQTRTERKCTPYTERQSRQQCEDYTDRVCTTSHRENCQNVPMQSCSAQIQSKGGRKCFDVNEQRCTLQEQVQMQTIQVPVTVQKCQKQIERICDTYYEVSSAGGRSQQCVNVMTPQCSYSQQTLNDKVCRTTTTFECDQSYPEIEASYPQESGYGSTGSSGGAAASSGSSEYGSSSFAAASTTSGYGEQKVSCRRSQKNNCQDQPRVVSVQSCVQKSERVCKDLVNTEPSVQAKQRCRNEEKRVCELVQRQQPKQVKTFSYRKDCQNVPRKLCADQGSQMLDANCGKTNSRQCSYTPVEQCRDEPKQHCFNVNFNVQRERCVDVVVPVAAPAYPAPQAEPQSGY